MMAGNVIWAEAIFVMADPRPWFRLLDDSRGCVYQVLNCVFRMSLYVVWFGFQIPEAQKIWKYFIVKLNIQIDLAITPTMG